MLYWWASCVTHVPWCMLGSLTSGFLWSRWRKNVPSIPGAWATQNFTCLVRGPWATLLMVLLLVFIKHLDIHWLHNSNHSYINVNTGNTVCKRLTFSRSSFLQDNEMVTHDLFLCQRMSEPMFGFILERIFDMAMSCLMCAVLKKVLFAFYSSLEKSVIWFSLVSYYLNMKWNLQDFHMVPADQMFKTVLYSGDPNLGKPLYSSRPIYFAFLAVSIG